MATRNRTILFRKYRDTLQTVGSPTSNGVRTDKTASQKALNWQLHLCFTPMLPVLMPLSVLKNPPLPGIPYCVASELNRSGAVALGLPPEWVDLSEDVPSNVQRAHAKMAELKKAHAKALMPSFGDGKEDQQRIETLTHEITDLIRRSERKLQRLAAAGPSKDSNVRKNVQHSLASELQSLSMELRKKQSAYLKRLRQQEEGPNGVDFEMNIQGSRSQAEDDDLDDTAFNEHQLTRIKKSEALTTEREQEIQQSVNELAQIMKDLSVLVIDQGTIVDRIDHNIQSVAATVEEGLKQLQKAERTQKHGGMVKCATVLIIMCFIMLVLLFLKEIFF
ncbi:hypothetical protein Cgig2_015161 [Carnegiea gigantea]|uniref:t-SNARE coiled-coil homology domain-containing protein n=1 Tax=Carnegiea gigantea TaxID=171969 RepID=A0A9Q1KRZ5_9CARY|nr:hypothetical protein Cgig2_015161 [Carnegiea gigantea]